MSFDVCSVIVFVDKKPEIQFTVGSPSRARIFLSKQFHTCAVCVLSSELPTTNDKVKKNTHNCEMFTQQSFKFVIIFVSSLYSVDKRAKEAEWKKPNISDIKVQSHLQLCHHERSRNEINTKSQTKRKIICCYCCCFTTPRFGNGDFFC